MNYKVVFKKSVKNDLKNIDKKELSKILEKITNNLPNEADKNPSLKGKFEGLRKYRIENYRIIYSIIQETILILRVKHRKEVYK